jgi:hypothetical protein
VAAAHESGNGAAKDEAQAAVFYGKACEANLASACVALGTMHEEGRGTARDDYRAAGLFDRACEARDDAGCRKLAALTQRTPAVALYLENQRRQAAERRAREAEARAREAEARARNAEAQANAARAAQAEDERRAADERARQQQAAQPSTSDRVWGAVNGAVAALPPPPPPQQATTVRQQQRELCYDHTYNGARTGRKCFGDRGAYCRSLCGERNMSAEMACKAECN